MGEMDFESLFVLMVLLGLLAATIVIRIIYFFKNRRKRQIDFDEFQDTEKIKGRDVVNEEEMKHEEKAIDEAYKMAYVEASAKSLNPITAHFAALDAAQQAKESLNDFKLLDAVDVDEEGVNEGTPIHNLKENGNNIEIELFKRWARGIFGCIKIGTEQQLKVVKDFMTDDLYSKFYMQAKAFEKDGIRFVTEELIVNKCAIYDYGRSLDKEEIKVLIDANMKEYIMNIQDQKVLRGSKDNYSNKRVLMTFQKKESDEPEGATMKNCPNCGSPISKIALGKCGSCGTVLLPIRYNWTLTKFETM